MQKPWDFSSIKKRRENKETSQFNFSLMFAESFLYSYSQMEDTIFIGFYGLYILKV